MKRKRKKNNPKAARDSKVFKGVHTRRTGPDKDVFGGMASWPPVATA